jgi:hypothetical protein
VQQTSAKSGSQAQPSRRRPDSAKLSHEDDRFSTHLMNSTGFRGGVVAGCGAGRWRSGIGNPRSAPGASADQPARKQGVVRHRGEESSAGQTPRRAVADSRSFYSGRDRTETILEAAQILQPQVIAVTGQTMLPTDRPPGGPPGSRGAGQLMMFAKRTTPHILSPC